VRGRAKTKKPRRSRAKKPIGFTPVPPAPPAPPAAKRGAKADANTEAAIAQWKALYLENRRAEQNVELARSVVKGEFAKHDVEYFTTSFGTIALQERGPRVTTDWEALARKLLSAKVIDKHLEAFTSSSPASSVLAAPREWAAEAGC
jgi:hypothetical protein